MDEQRVLRDRATGVVARNIYRYCQATGKAYYRLVATLSDNTTTTYTDNVADSSLGAILPLINTTNSETLASPEATITVPANSLLKVTCLNANSIVVPTGAKNVNVYVGTTSNGETKQDYLPINAQNELEIGKTFDPSYSWTEPTTGLITGKALPSANTTHTLCKYGVYEQPGAFGTQANRYSNNKFYGIPAGQEFRLETTDIRYKRVRRGNISNPTMVLGAEESVEDRPYDLGNQSGAINLNPTLSTYLRLTATGNITPTILPGDYKGQQLIVEVNQDATGGRTWTKTTTTKAAGGTVALTVMAGGRDLYTFEWDGSAWVEIGRALNVS